MTSATPEPSTDNPAPDRPAPDIRAYLETRTAGPAGFSPGGERLLVSSDVPGSSQLFLIDAAAVRPEGVPVESLAQLTDLPEPVGGGWLPVPVDGRDTLLVGLDAGGNERNQLYLLTPGDLPALSAGGPLTTTDALTPLLVDTDYIHNSGGVTRDGTYLAYSTNRRNGSDFDVWVRDLGSPPGEPAREEPVHEGGGWNWGGGFSPDGRYLAIGALTTLPGDSTLHLYDRQTGTSTQIAPHDEPSEVGSPAWLPDSSAFFFSTDVGRDQVGIARGTPDGAWEVVLEPGWESGCAVDWAGRHLLVAVNADGATRATLHDPASLAVTAEVPLPGAGVAGGFRFSRDGRFLTYAYTSPLVPGDGWLYDTDTGSLSRLTVSPNRLGPSVLVAPDLVRIPAHDGEQIPAYVFRPRGRTGRRPVVMIMHGGPEGQYRPTFGALTQYLVARGFAVVAPNVRGSSGYGKRYQALDDVELRFDSIRDMASVHAWLASTDDLDAGRAAIYGGSYGGYMVLAGLAFQPELWAAGVCIVGMSSLVTFLQNTAPYRRVFREREYGSLAHHRDLLEELSPLNRLDDMRAPLFLVHGVNDPRVPVGEAEQIHAALQKKGVRSELAVYADEGHGLGKLKNRLDAYPRVADFLVDVLKP